MPAAQLPRGRAATPGFPFPSQGRRPSAQTGSGAFGGRPPFGPAGSPPVAEAPGPRVGLQTPARPSGPDRVDMSDSGALNVYFGSCWGRFFSLPSQFPLHRFPAGVSGHAIVIRPLSASPSTRRGRCPVHPLCLLRTGTSVLCPECFGARDVFTAFSSPWRGHSRRSRKCFRGRAPSFLFAHVLKTLLWLFLGVALKKICRYFEWNRFFNPVIGTRWSLLPCRKMTDSQIFL